AKTSTVEELELKFSYDEAMHCSGALAADRPRTPAKGRARKRRKGTALPDRIPLSPPVGDDKEREFKWMHLHDKCNWTWGKIGGKNCYMRPGLEQAVKAQTRQRGLAVEACDRASEFDELTEALGIEEGLHFFQSKWDMAEFAKINLPRQIHTKGFREEATALPAEEDEREKLKELAREVMDRGAANSSSSSGSSTVKKRARLSPQEARAFEPGIEEVVQSRPVAMDEGDDADVEEADEHDEHDEMEVDEAVHEPLPTQDDQAQQQESETIEEM
ncbi:unnamed protein product, partial [Chrysoparadoxa australica]